jgi:GNAT superfamily N-acetyltransferase
MDSLRRLENWNQTPADLKRFLDYEPRGCFLARLDGEAVGTVTTTTYGQELGWIGMMLVHPEFRRRGIASALMKTSLDYLNEKGIACIKLDATPAGKPVYERLGFCAEWEFERWERKGDEASQFDPSIAAEFEPPAFDEAIFGADRSAWLKLLAAGSRVIEKQGAYAMLRPGARAAYLGPVVAENPNSARELIHQLIDSCESTIIWDVPGPNTIAVEIAKSLGFQPVRKLLRMWTGRKRIEGDATRQFALADPATG